MKFRKPIKLADLNVRKPKPILPNMMPGHWREYKNGNKVWVNGYFRKSRSRKSVLT